jgi:hypothetical protein
VSDPGNAQAQIDQANVEKAKADAESAKWAAAKARREEEEASTPTAVAQRAVAAAKDATDAQRAQVASLIPDFSKSDRGSLSVNSGGQPTAGTGVGAEALRRAGHEVAKAVEEHVTSDRALLVTTDTDLATSDAAYTNVDTELTWFTALVAKTLNETDLEARKPTDSEPTSPAGGAPSPKRGLLPGLVIADAVAQAVPSILSLFSAHRTVTTGTDALDDVAASVVVAGALKRGNQTRLVFHDSLRLLGGGQLGQRLTDLRDNRDKLDARKVDLQKRNPPADGSPPTASQIAEAIALATSVLASVDAFLQGLTSIPQGASQSTLATALLRQGLHDRTFEHVLIVKAEASSAIQAMDDKPLLFKDTIAVFGVASITWALIRTSDGSVVDADIATATAQANGKIGDTFAMSDAEQPAPGAHIVPTGEIEELP